MAEQFNVACTCLVKVDVGSGLVNLGYTTDGVQISTQDFRTPIHTDELGGTAGPPVDVIDHGQIATVTLELAKYDSAVLDVLRTFRSGGSNGVVGSACVLMRGGAKTFRLLLTATNFTRNYPIAMVVGEVREGPIGSQATRANITFECHMNLSTGVLHNAATS